MPPVDAGSISSSIRIKLAELNSDIVACKTAFDNLGTEFANKAEKYSTLAGKKYANSLKTIATEMKNVEGAAKAGALSEAQAVQRLIDLRKTELAILQNKAVKEGTASAETVAAIRKTEAALTGLQEKQQLLAGKQGGGLGSAFASLRDFMQGPIAAAKEFIAVLQALKAKIDEAENAWAAQAEATALVKNTLKTTGAAAWTTFEHMEELSGSLQKLTKFGDETVLSMETVLLGFRNIQGTNFDKATEAVLDMATVMKMDLTAAAQAVGKALDNPALGLDSLSKQGFKFTQQEKETMKAMQEAGDIAGAQAIILKELDKTYGGAAKAAGALDVSLRDRLKNAMGDITEEMGRSVSRGLAPFRKWWLDIATAVGAAAKAQNDFKDAIDRTQKGVGTTTDRIADLQIQLKHYQDLQESGLDTADQYFGGLGVYDETIASIKQQIASLKALDSAQKSAAKYLDEKSKREAEDAERKAKADALQLEITKARNELEEEYRDRLVEINRQLKVGIIDEKMAGEERQSALKSEIDGLTKMVDKYDLAEGATFNLRAEKTKLYVAGIKGAEIAKLEAKTTIDAVKNALDFQQKYAKSQADESAATSRSIEDMTESYRKQADAILEADMTASEKSKSQLLKALELADAYEAQGYNVTALREALKAYFDLIEKENPEAEFKDKIKKWEEYASKVTSVISSIAAALGSMYEAEIAELDARYEHERELIENNGRTKEEALQAELDAAIAAGDAEAEAEARKKLELYKLEEKYEKEKAQLQYKADMVSWTANGLTLAAETAIAIMKAWADGGPILGALAIAEGAGQALAWGAAKPKPPAFSKGGIVEPTSYSGTPIIAAEGGNGDILFGTGAMGRPLMNAFADDVAARVAARSGGEPIIVQVVLDGKVVAESTARRIRNGEVEITR
jgi:hypothetical protein